MRRRSDARHDVGRVQGPGHHGRFRFAASVAALAVALVAGLLGALNAGADPAEVEPAGVAPVEATYHGVKPYNTIAVGQLQYDAWTYRDIVFYSPPGMVTQEMANQWLAWYATTDDILRALINDDAHFESRFRGNDVNFGRVKVIGTPPDSCGAGCGNKAVAEGVGIIDQMVAEPDNYEHHWILFYEQARGGVDEAFDLAATWPREAYHLPHLVAALTFYEIDGANGLTRGVPADIHRGLQKWIDHGQPYVDLFVEREQRWFDDTFADGTIIFPPQTSMLLHLAIDEGYDTVGRVLSNLGQYPDNLIYPDSTTAMCDWQAAVNDATGNAYAERMVNEWQLPGGCTYDMGQNQSGPHHPNDLRFEANGLCAHAEYKPGTAQVGHVPCDGSADQQSAIRDDRGDGTFLLSLGDPDRCLDVSGSRLVTWSCHGAANQVWQWNGDQLQNPDSGMCVTANPRTRWGGGTLAMEPCTNSPAQRINTAGVLVTTTTRPTTTQPSTTQPSTTQSSTTVAPTTQSSTTVAPTTTLASTTTQPPTTHLPTTPTTRPTTEPPTTGWPSGRTALVNIGSGKCLDQGPASEHNGANVIQWQCGGHLHMNQLMTAVEGADGNVMLQFAHSNKCLDEWDGNLYQWECHGQSHQLFTWVGAQLQSLSSGWCLTIESGSLDNGANLLPAPCINSPAQQFRLETYGR